MKKSIGFTKDEKGVSKYVDKEKKIVCFLGEDRVSSWYFLFLRHDGKNYLLSGENKDDLLSDLKEFETIVSSSSTTNDEVSDDENIDKNDEGGNSGMGDLTGASGL